MEKWSIKKPEYKIIKDINQAKSFLKKTKKPVVLKASSASMLHKTELGAVFTDINSTKQLSASYKKLRQNTKGLSPDIIIQEQIQGHQVIIGAKRDREFGIVVLFGLGGIFVEIIKDFSIAVAPITKKDALTMIKKTKAYDILTGKRTKKKANIVELANLIYSVAKLMQQKRIIREIDLNPVIVNIKGAYVVDPKIII